jgi:pimeloyl-ACP methyl ester carboxylesterase
MKKIIDNVFIHGSHHGAWCWRDFDDVFSSIYFNNYYLDLPGHGKKIDSHNRYTLDDYVESVIDVITKLENPVNLIGHSFGGCVISQVAESIPEKIDKLIYLCAFLLPSGYTAEKLIEKTGIISPLSQDIEINLKNDFMKLSEETLRAYTYNRCTEKQIQYALKHYCDEPLQPTMQSLNLSDDNYGHISRYYIRANYDCSILPKLQDYMIKEVGVREVFSLDSDHSPFFSTPTDLSRVLKTII